MNVINIKSLILALEDIEYDYDFKISERKDGSAILTIPDFILNDIEYAIEKGYPTPREQVCATFNRFDY